MENNALEPVVLYENDEVLALDKPAGLMVHEDGRTNEPTLVDWIRANRPAIEGVGEPMRLQNGSVIERPGIVHRLDRDTSGVILIAKTPESFASLKEQFQSHTIQKTYAAFLYGTLSEKEGVIDRPIGRSSKNPRLRSAQRGARGAMREAQTAYRVLEEGNVRGEALSYVEALPQTGRTHQIRVHFKAIHHPVLCDKLYAPKQPCLLGFARLALHARIIEFTLASGRHSVEAPLPADFVAALASLRQSAA